jgi:hypothetical protein
MLVFHSVLAAKPLAALHARPAANTLPPPAPQPTGPTPQPPAPLPRAVARKGAQNQNLGAVNDGRAQNTLNGNATSAAATNPAAPRDVPAQNMPRGTIGNDNRSPDNAQPTIQQPAQQPVALAANGGPSYVPTALDPAQTQDIGHPGPPDRDRLRRCPPPNQHRCLPRQRIRKLHIPVWCHGRGRQILDRARSRIRLDPGRAQSPKA